MRNFRVVGWSFILWPWETLRMSRALRQAKLLTRRRSGGFRCVTCDKVFPIPEDFYKHYHNIGDISAMDDFDLSSGGK